MLCVNVTPETSAILMGTWVSWQRRMKPRRSSLPASMLISHVKLKVWALGVVDRRIALRLLGMTVGAVCVYVCMMCAVVKYIMNH